MQIRHLGMSAILDRCRMNTWCNIGLIYKCAHEPNLVHLMRFENAIQTILQNRGVGDRHLDLSAILRTCLHYSECMDQKHIQICRLWYFHLFLFSHNNEPLSKICLGGRLLICKYMIT